LQQIAQLHCLKQYILGYDKRLKTIATMTNNSTDMIYWHMRLDRFAISTMSCF